MPIEKFDGESPRQWSLNLLKTLRLKIWFLIFGSICLFLIFLALWVNKIKQSSTSPSPIPTPIITSYPEKETTASPSAYATDSAILKLEKEIEEVAKEIQATDLRESKLNPPVLDMEVSFEQ